MFLDKRRQGRSTEFRMQLPAQARSCGDGPPLLVLTARPTGQPLWAAGGLLTTGDRP